jgi:hypothetical protein
MADVRGLTYSEDAILDLTPVGDWYYDESGYHSYVVITGSLGQLAGTTKRMREAGIALSTSGRCYRPANNGRMYDWYIRLDRVPASKRPTKDQIEKALGLGVRATETELPPALTELRAQLAAARMELKETVRQLNEEKAGGREKVERLAEVSAALERESRRAERLQVLHEAVDRDNAELREQKRTLDDRVLLLTGELDGLRASTGNELSSLSGRLNEQEIKSSEKVDELARQLSGERERAARLTDEKREAEQAWEVTERQLASANEDALRARLDLENQKAIDEAHRASIESVRDQLAMKVRELEAAACDTSGARTESELASWLGALLPRVNLTEASVSYLRNEIQDPIGAFSVLERLNSQPLKVRGDKVESAEGWFELHFNTGDSDLGRLYFMNKGSSMYHVHMGHKDTQRQDFAELRVVNSQLTAQRARQRR